MKKWESYEDVAKYLLNKFSHEFGLKEFQGKQKILGVTGATWEIDAKGVYENKTSIIIVECKRYLERKIEQSIVGQLAYTITDTGANGGIIVSPLGFQEGAKKVAKKENVIEVKLSSDSSYNDYFLEFMNKIFVGMTMEIHPITILDVRSSVKSSIFMDIGGPTILSVDFKPIKKNS